MSGTMSENKSQQTTTNDNDWYSELQRVTMSSIKSDNE